MKNLFYSVIAVIIFSVAAFAQNTQKGVDTQTQKIKEDATTDTTKRSNDVSRSWETAGCEIAMVTKMTEVVRTAVSRNVFILMERPT